MRGTWGERERQQNTRAKLLEIMEEVDWPTPLLRAIALHRERLYGNRAMAPALLPKYEGMQPQEDNSYSAIDWRSQRLGTLRNAWFPAVPRGALASPVLSN